MSSSFVCAAAVRAQDASTTAIHNGEDEFGSCPQWGSLPGPALISIAIHLLNQWPDTLPNLVGASEVCRNWEEAMRCDAVLQALIEHSGLVAPAALVPLAAYYFAHRGVHQSFRVSSLFGFLDATVTPYQMLVDARHVAHKQQVTKRASSPDVSWAFSERGFSCLADRMVWWSVHVDIFSDECRIGFTDNVQSLLYSREAFMSYEEPHLWCYSDGSRVRGIHAGGRQLSRNCTTYRPGDVVTVCLDFERNRAAWFLNLARADHASLVYVLEGLPSQQHGASGAHAVRELRAAIVLDEEGDTVRFSPLVSAAERRRGERLLAVSEWCAHGMEVEVNQQRRQQWPQQRQGAEVDLRWEGLTTTLSVAERVALHSAFHADIEGRAYVASRFLQDVEPSLHPEESLGLLPSRHVRTHAGASSDRLLSLFLKWLQDEKQSNLADELLAEPWVPRRALHPGEFLGWVPTDDDEEEDGVEQDALS